MYHILSNALGHSSTLAAAGSYSAPQQSLHVPGTSSLTGSNSARATVRRELDSRLSDLLGSEDDWDDEDSAEKEGTKGMLNVGRASDSRGDTTQVKTVSTAQNTKASEVKSNESGATSRLLDGYRGESQALSELDDMDAGLFGSFAQSQKKREGRKTKPADRAMPQGISSTRSTSTASQPLSKGVDVSAKPPSNPIPKKQRASDFDDDLLSLLSDEPEEKTSGARHRPKFQMKSRQKGPDVATSVESSSSGHLTDVVEEQLEQVTMSDGSEERPKSRRGHLQPPERLSKTTIPAGSSSGLNILTRDSVSRNEGEISTEKTSEGERLEPSVSEGRKRVEEKRSHSTSRVDFEGEDDLLSGLGLSDEDTSQPRSFLGQKRLSKPLDLQKTDGRKNMESKSGGTEDKEEGYMFGGYLPSVASGTRRVGLPTSEGRSGRPSEASSHHGTTGSAQYKHQLKKLVPKDLKHGPIEDVTAPAKKSVRFSDEVTNDIELSNTTTSVSHQPRTDALNTQRVSEVPRKEKEYENGSPSAETGAQSLQAKITPYKEEDGLTKTVGQNEPEGRLEHPVFPWQQKKRSTGDFTTIIDDGGLLGGQDMTSESKNKLSGPTLKPKEEATGNKTALTGSILPSRESERQSKQEQRRRAEGVEMSQVPNIGMGLEKERTQNSDLKERVKLLEHQLEASEEKQKLLAEKSRHLEEAKVKLHGSLSSKDVALTSELEELRAKLHRVELEKDQLQHTIEMTKAHHKEEQAAMEKSHSTRIQAIEESFHRRETKWQEELESEASRQKEKLEQMERDRTDTVLALRKKIESLEIAKTSEISQLQETHRSSVADLKRENELDLQRVKELHRQEIEALKATHSHTRQLSELSRLVEEATRGVSGLQSRVEQSHRQGMEDSQHISQTHQQHLKTLEERLNKQYRDMESERELLRSLASRLESQLCQQTQAVESERWNVQQETARLRAAERALEEEKKLSLARLEEQKRHLTESKEKFLVEQQKLLSECLREHQSVASERAQLSLQQREMAEAEKKEAQRRQAMEAELEAALAAAKEENARLVTEAAQLEAEESRLKTESSRVKQAKEAVERDRINLQEQRTQVEWREEEANKLRQSATALHKEAEDMMLASQRLQAELAEKKEALKTEQEHLENREGQLASERLAFARECRQLHSRQSSFPHSPIHVPEPILASTQRLETPRPPSPVLTQSLPQPLKLDNSLSHTQQQQQQSMENGDTVSSALSSLKRSRQLRNMAWGAEKDDLELRKEREFLELVHHQNSVLLSNHYRRQHLVNN